METAPTSGGSPGPTRFARRSARLPGPTFIPGRYRLNIFVGIPYLEHVDEIPDAFEFEIVAPARPGRPYQLHITRGMVCRKAQWDCVVSDPQTA